MVALGSFNASPAIGIIKITLAMKSEKLKP